MDFKKTGFTRKEAMDLLNNFDNLQIEVIGQIQKGKLQRNNDFVAILTNKNKFRLLKLWALGATLEYADGDYVPNTQTTFETRFVARNRVCVTNQYQIETKANEDQLAFLESLMDNAKIQANECRVNYMSNSLRQEVSGSSQVFDKQMQNCQAIQSFLEKEKAKLQQQQRIIVGIDRYLESLGVNNQTKQRIMDIQPLSLVVESAC